MAIKIVSFPSYKMVISHSYVKLPEGHFSEGRIMGGEGVHIVETRMFCTVCLQTVNALIVP